MSSATVRASSARSRQCFGSLMGIFAIAARYSGAYFEFCAVAERRDHAVGECIRIFIPPGRRCPNFLARVSKRAPLEGAGLRPELCLPDLQALHDLELQRGAEPLCF
jgi:hypothetical protein